MLRYPLLTCIALLACPGLASAQSVETGTTSESGAVLHDVDADPFADVFAAPAPAEATEPSGLAPEAAAPAEAAPEGAAPTEAAVPAPEPPRATGEGLYYGPYLRLSGLVVRDKSFGLVAPFAALVRLEGGVEVAPFAAARGLAFELGLGIGVQGDTSFDQVESQLLVTSFQLSAIYRQPIFQYLAAYARATGAANLVHLRLAKGFSEKEVDQLASNAAVGGTLGLELTIPLGYTPQGCDGRAVDNYLGFFFEAGYEVHTSVAFDSARRDVSEDTEPARIPISSEPIGDLSLTGWIWRLGGSFRF